jgi:hypothetical protein
MCRSNDFRWECACTDCSGNTSKTCPFRHAWPCTVSVPWQRKRAVTAIRRGERHLPEEEGKPTDHESSHYDAQGAGCLVLSPPARTLLPYSGACNTRTQTHLSLTRACSLMPKDRPPPLKSTTFWAEKHRLCYFPNTRTNILTVSKRALQS